MNLPTRAFASLPQRLQKTPPILSIQKNRLLPNLAKELTRLTKRRLLGFELLD